MGRFCIVILTVLAVGTALCGCPALKAADPKPELAVSSDTYDFGTRGTHWSFFVWNGGAPGTTLDFVVFAEPEWLYVSPAEGSCAALDRPQTVDVAINRKALTRTHNRGTIAVSSNAGGVIVEVTVTVPDEGGEGEGEGEVNAVVVYVDRANPSGQEDGLSWKTAYTTLQPAIDAADEAGGGEVWVAQGLYNEPRQTDNGAIVMRPGTHLYGGFAGGETERDARDPLRYISTIDASNARAGAPAYHAVIGADNATLDGFTVKGGQALQEDTEDYKGGGLYNSYVAPTVENCVFTGNMAGYGGAVYTVGAAPRITHCVFKDNRVWGKGGALYNKEAWPVVAQCAFADNSAITSGGAVFNEQASPRIRDCAFARNQAGVSGGALYNYRSPMTLINSILWANYTLGAGAGAVNDASNARIVCCTFAANSGPVLGAGLWNWKSSPEIVNCIFWDEPASTEILDGDDSSQPSVSFCGVRGGYPGEGNIKRDPLFRDLAAGDCRLTEGSPCIDAGRDTANPRFGGADADFTGQPRGFDGDGRGPDGTGDGSEYDIGAFEYAGEDGAPIPSLLDWGWKTVAYR